MRRRRFRKAILAVALLVSWIFYSIRLLPLETVSLKLEYGQSREEVADLLTQFKMYFEEEFDPPQVVSCISGKVRFRATGCLVSRRLSYTHDVSFLKYEYLHLYFDAENKLVGYEYGRSS